MGVFNKIAFVCPNCESLIMMQSKADYEMNEYLSEIPDNIPQCIIEDIKEENIQCRNCKEIYTIKVETVNKLTLKHAGYHV